MTTKENMTAKEKRLDALTKAAAVLCKLMEVAYHIVAVSMVVGLALFFVDRTWLPGKLVAGLPEAGGELAVQSFSIRVANPDGTLNSGALVVFLLAAGVILELMALVFRNVNLILRTTQGLTKFSQGRTPFQKDNVRMLREIGIFLISTAVAGLLFSAVAVLVVGPEGAEISAGMENIVLGILMLCLSQYFAIGQQMQEDVDGLV